MSIVTTKALEGDQAAYAPCILTGTSSRDPQGCNVAITGYGNSSGRFAITHDAGVTPFENNDTITIKGATGDLAKYNGRHRVWNVISPTNLITDTSWSGGTTAAIGTLYRSNDNILIRGDVYNVSSVLIGSVYVQPTNGSFSMDFARTFQTMLSSIFSLTAGDRPTTGAAAVYKIKMFEQWQSPTFAKVEFESAGYEQNGLVHRTTTVANNITGVDLLQSNNVIAEGGKLLVHFMTHKTTNVSVLFTSSTGSLTIISTTIVNKHGLAVYQVPTGAKWVTALVRFFNGSEYEIIKTPLLVRVIDNSCGKRLYFLNRLGGYSSIEFKEYDKITEAEKIDQYAVKSWLYYSMDSVIEARGSAAYFDGITDALEVYDENGVATEVLDKQVTHYANGNIQLNINIRNEQHLIN